MGRRALLRKPMIGKYWLRVGVHEYYFGLIHLILPLYYKLIFKRVVEYAYQLNCEQTIPTRHGIDKSVLSEEKPTHSHLKETEKNKERNKHQQRGTRFFLQLTRFFPA